MATSRAFSPPGYKTDGEAVFDPDPTVEVPQTRPSTPHPGANVGLVKGSLGSLSGEIHTLRRRRLGAGALFLALAFGVSFLWSFFGRSDFAWVASTTIGVRVVIAAAVAGLLLSRIALTRNQVRVAEYFLFGSCTLLMALNQYVVNLDLLRHDDVPGVIAFVKNGVFGTVMLMVIYGMFVPNDPKHAAKVVLAMALVQVIVLVLVMDRPDVSTVVDLMRTTERAGSNIVSLLIGAALAIYGAYVLNGLRTQLHEARKFGQYQLREKIGVGGMGEVYLAEHQLLKRPCALKLIKAEVGGNPTALARFEREVQSAARLGHPNTIEIYDYGHANDGTFYYVMEYLEGMSLADLVKEHGPLPPGRAIFLLRQVCAGLAEAHRLGLVHRDLKPANIYVALRGGEFDVAKVLDFGLVKPTKDPQSALLTTDHTVSGTPQYMAPEQATADRTLDARADIYALGAIAYYMLTGRPPFQGDGPFAVMIAHARDPVVPPSRVRPGVPGDLEQVVLRCLAKGRQDRYPDVKALGKALAACASAADWDGGTAEAWWTEKARATPSHPQPALGGNPS